MAKYLLKSCRQAALMLFGAGTFSVAIVAIILYLLRNSNGSFVSDDYEIGPNAGSIVFWRTSTGQHFKLDKWDLIQLIAASSVCFLGWLIYSLWPLSLRRRPRGAFPIQSSRQPATPIAVEPIGPIAAMAASIPGLAAFGRLRRARRIILWCALAAWLILTMIGFMRAAPPTAAQQKSILDAEESKYMAAEGHQKRGKDFAAVAGRMDLLSLSKSPFTWSEVQGYLGPPDLYAGPLNQPTAVVYLYDRYAKKDCAVIIQFDSQGRTKQFSWTAPPLPGWSAYPTTLPTTMPPTTKP